MNFSGFSSAGSFKTSEIGSDINSGKLVSSSSVNNQGTQGESNLTKVSIDRLPYQKSNIRPHDNEWKKFGKHLSFTIDPLNESGILYVSVDKDQQEQETEHSSVKNDESMDVDTNVYFFDEPSKMDTSKHYTDYIEKTYKLVQPLLVDSQYQDYYDDNEETQIGVIDQIQESIKARKLALCRFIGTFKDNLLQLLNAKNDANEIDMKAYDYQEILHVLSLLHALKFSNDEEKIELFVEWVNRADVAPDNETIDDIEKSYDNVSFWTLVIKKLVSRGIFTAALELIDCCGYDQLQEDDSSAADFLLIEDLKSLLSSYDVINFSTDLTEFLSWKKSVVSFREYISQTNFKNKELASCILQIVSLMSGYSQSIIESSTTWYECFLSLYLYQMPSSELIYEYFETSKKNYSSDPQSTWESICIELFEGNYLTVISSLEGLDRPSATFTSVLLEASGLFQGYLSLAEGDSNLLNATTDKKLESLALEFFSSGNKRLFPVGVGILKALNTSDTREIISEILPSYECETNDDFEWCLAVCAELRLTKTATNLYKTQGHYLLSQGLLMESLQCFAEAKEYGLISRTIWSIFEISLIENKAINDEVLIDTIESLNDNRPSNILEFLPALKQALSPYAVLVNFYDHLRKSSVVDATDCLLRLLSFKYLPAYQKVVLFAQFFYLLSDEKFEGEIRIGQLYSSIKELNTFSKQLANEDSNDDHKETSKKAEYLYSFVISEKVVKSEDGLLPSYDWRLKFDHNEFPKDVDELIVTLRTRLGLAVGKRFVTNNL